MAIKEIMSSEFNDEVLLSKETVLVDFNATWCGPCKMLKPILEAASKKHSDKKIVGIDVDKNPELAQQYGVMSIPMLFVFKDGKVVNTAVGFRGPAEIEKMLNM